MLSQIINESLFFLRVFVNNSVLGTVLPSWQQNSRDLPQAGSEVLVSDKKSQQMEKVPSVSARPQLLQRVPSPTPFQRWERVRPGGTDIEQKTQKSQKSVKTLREQI